MKKILFGLSFILSFNLLATEEVNRTYQGVFKLEGVKEEYMVVSSKTFMIIEDSNIEEKMDTTGLLFQCKELTNKLTAENFPILKCTAVDGDVAKLEFRIKNKRLQFRLTDIDKVGPYVNLIRY
jgi:hypothetical protein